MTSFVTVVTEYITKGVHLGPGVFVYVNSIAVSVHPLSRPGGSGTAQ